VYAERGDYDSALKELKKAVGINKKNARAYLTMGEVQERQGDLHEALRSYSKSLELSKGFPEAAQVETKAKALRVKIAAQLHAQGLQRYREGKEKQALDMWDDAIAMDPTLVGALRDRGLTYHKAGKYDKAIKDFSSALEKDTQNAELHRIRGDSFYRSHDYEKALEDYHRALQLNPRDAVAHNNRGLLYHEKKDLTKGLADYSRAIEIDPSNPTFYENRALALISLGKTKESLRDYRKALSLLTDERRKEEIQEKISLIEAQPSGKSLDGTATNSQVKQGMESR